MSKNFKKNILFKLKAQKPPVLHRHILMCCACSFLQSGGLVCLATLGGSCLHSGSAHGRPGVPSLVHPFLPLLPGKLSRLPTTERQAVEKNSEKGRGIGEAKPSHHSHPFRWCPFILVAKLSDDELHKLSCPAVFTKPLNETQYLASLKLSQKLQTIFYFFKSFSIKLQNLWSHIAI